VYVRSLDQAAAIASAADSMAQAEVEPPADGVFNVHAYGAKGDGVADDTVAIQTALLAARNAGSPRKGILLPAGTYRLTETIVLKSRETIYGEQAQLTWEGRGFCIQIEGSYNRIRGLSISITDSSLPGDPGSIHWGYYGAIVIGAWVTDAPRTTICNVIDSCTIHGGVATYENPNSVGIFLHGHRVVSGDYCAVYFNTISGNVIRRFYRGTLHRYEANANFYRDNLLWRYYKYGLDINTGSQNIVSSGFFHQAPGRSREDMTYAVRIGMDPTETAPNAHSPIYNQLFYGAEPGAFSSALYNEGGSTVAILNSNTPYGSHGTAGFAFLTGRSGDIAVGRTARFHDRDDCAPLNIAARKMEPRSPSAGDVYLDDGTNTGGGQPGWRHWTGSAWIDIGGQNTFGTDSVAPGTITLWHGGGANNPGYIRIHSPNGTPYYLFVDDGGTLKVHDARPTQNSDGIAVTQPTVGD
jgi:hypothetical protein